MNGIFHFFQFFISVFSSFFFRGKFRSSPTFLIRGTRRQGGADGGKRCLFPREIRTFAKIIFVSFRWNGKNTFRGKLDYFGFYTNISPPPPPPSSNAPGIHNKRMIVVGHLFISTLLNQSCPSWENLELGYLRGRVREGAQQCQVWANLQPRRFDIWTEVKILS